MLADFLDLASSMVVTLHIQSIDQSAAIKNVKRKITDLQKMTIEEKCPLAGRDKIAVSYTLRRAKIFLYPVAIYCLERG